MIHLETKINASAVCLVDSFPWINGLGCVSSVERNESIETLQKLYCFQIEVIYLASSRGKR